MRTLFNNSFIRATVIAVVAMGFPRASLAADPLVGNDNANQSAYSDGWQTGDDGSASGDGFSGWFLASSTSGSNTFAGFFIGDSRNISGGSGADINVNTNSWGMYASNGGVSTNSAYADAYRWLVEPDGTTHTTLGVGQTFSIDLAVNYRNGFKGIDLRDASDNTFFNLNIGADDYVVSGSGVTSGAGSISDAYANNTALHLTFTQTSTNGGIWTISRTGAIADFDSGTYTNAPLSFKLYVGNTDSGSENDFYANNVRIVSGPVYETWAYHYFPNGGGGALGGADPDGDGAINSNEFVAGFNPTNSAIFARVISTVKSNNDIYITYLGADGDSTFYPGYASRTNVLEFTAGGPNNSYTNNFASTSLTNILSGGTGSGLVTNFVDPGAAVNPARYYRVRVLAP